MKQKLIGILAVLILFGMTGMAQASLTHIGFAIYDDGIGDVGAYKLIYDDDLLLTWLDYSHQVGNWGSQDTWARGLNDANGSYGDVFEYSLFSGVTVNWEGEVWRLPDAHNQDGSGPDYGFNVTGSEMGHLYYEELVSDLNATYTNANGEEVPYFYNLIASWYWFGTESANDPDFAWCFHMDGGRQDYNFKNHLNGYGLAVRSGEVSIIPIPSAVWLFGSGLIGLIGFRRKFR